MNPRIEPLGFGISEALIRSKVSLKEPFSPKFSRQQFWILFEEKKDPIELTAIYTTQISN
jgi:hypothetical protein